MGQQLGGAGIALPPPQNFYPTQLNNAPQDPSTNAITLAPGDCFVVPAGNFYLHLSGPLVTQYKDPVNGLWSLPIDAAEFGHYIASDGQNFRVANLTGCAVGAVISVGGSGYSQATTTAVASSGNSTWQPIVGGSLTVSSITVSGGNYGVPPILLIPPPPSPGFQATGTCAITSGTVSSIVLDNVGAGYTAVPTAAIVPSPFDPNLNAGITQASCLISLISSGSVTGMICTNHGASVSTAPSITISGAGTLAQAVPFLMTTLTSVSVTNAGVGYTSTMIAAAGGVPTTTSGTTNPLHEGKKFIPRPPQAGLTASGNSITGSTIYDGGLFLGTPTVIPLASGASVSTYATVTGAFGGANGSFWLQPAP